ncbi:MAG: GerMN domain-containing protein [Patescibacteria group bacterium]
MEESKEPKAETPVEATNSEGVDKPVEGVVAANTPSAGQTTEPGQPNASGAEVAPPDQAKEIKEVEFFENKVESVTETVKNNTQESVDNNNDKPKDGLKDEKIKKSEDKLDYKTIIAVIVILIGIALVVWYKDKQGKQTQTDTGQEENINIVVDSSQEQGKVKIVDSSRQEIKSNEATSTETTASTTDSTNKIKVINYYTNTQNDPQLEDCSRVYPLEREAENKYPSKEVNTIRNLLMPLSAEEKSRGFVSSIPEGTMLKRLVLLPGGVAEVHFTATLGRMGGSCATAAVRAQIEATLKQFPYIKTVNICVEDNCQQDEILQP